MADRVGIGKTLCMVHGNVKHTSMEGTSKFKTGNLELAVSESGQVVCIVNYAIGPSKKFVVSNGFICDWQHIARQHLVLCKKE